MTATFLITSLVICLAPGTGAIFTLAAGLARGSSGALLAAVAGTLGTVPHMLAAITGLAAVLHASGIAFQVLKYAGVCYLLWMAWSTWHDRGSLAVEAGSRHVGWRSVMWSGVTLNLLNPKLTIFFFAFLPQFVPAGTESATLRMIGLSLVFMAMTFVVFLGYGLAAAALRDQVLSRPRVVDRLRRAFAVSFAGLGARLAFESRT